MAISGLISNVMMAYPALCAMLIAFTGSWRQAYVMLAQVIALLSLGCLLLMQTSPETVGLLPDGSAVPLLEGENSVENDMKKRTGKQQDFTFSEATRTSAFWAVVLSHCIVSVTWTGFNFHSIDYMLQHSVSEAFTSSLSPLMSFSMIITI